MSDFRTQLKRGLYTGIKRGWSSFVWICKIVVPVSFLAALIQWSGWLNQLDFLLHPLMSLINLPAAAALPIITGVLINIYAAIAIMAVLPFTIGQMTLIAVFLLSAHNLIMEGMVQHKSGFNIIKATLVRIGAAILTVLIVSQFFADTGQSIVMPAALAVDTPFIEVVKGWTIATLGLCGRIFVIIMTVMMLLDSLQSLGWTKYLHRTFKPFMKILGLSDRAIAMWVAAAGFGLLYGGAVIIEEAKKGALTKEELEHLHISIGINHAIVEDPALFLALGLNAFWLWIPRFVIAAIVGHTCRAIQYLKSKSLPR